MERSFQIMGKKATKAANNMYCMARYEAAENNDSFSSREKASEVLNIDRTRLANIELGNITPYPEEVYEMSKCYNTPELCNSHCSINCPIGKHTMSKVDLEDFDRLSLKVLGSLNDIESIQNSLISISQDGVVDASEREEFINIIKTLERISDNSTTLKLWAEKNIKL